MQALCPRPDEHTAIRTDLKAIFVSLELSHSTWVITSLAPGGGEKMSKHSVRNGDIPALLARLSQLKEKASCLRYLSARPGASASLKRYASAVIFKATGDKRTRMAN